jgi:hypothetical protein
MRVYLETMGCQMNRLDSELVTSLLRAAGHEMTDDRKAADVVLYNTCSVRQHAEDKVHSRLGAEARRKANRPGLVVGVLGCMAQRLGEDLQRRWAAVDIICAPGQLARLPELIAAARAGRPGVALDPDRRIRNFFNLANPCHKWKIKHLGHPRPDLRRISIDGLLTADHQVHLPQLPYSRRKLHGRRPGIGAGQVPIRDKVGLVGTHCKG